MTFHPTGPREAELLEATDLLLDARRTMTPIASLPEACRPVSLDEAYFIQDRIAESHEPIGGWKVGASSPVDEPRCAPMPLAGIRPGGACMRAGIHRYRGLEAEATFLLGQDLPPRLQPYTHAEILAAIASCHPAIEVLESSFQTPGEVDSLSKVADLQLHGGLVFGPACPGWLTIDFDQEKVSLDIDGTIRVGRTGSNPAQDLIRLVQWLANAGASRTHGLRAGQWVTTGSWTGNTLALAGSSVDVRFSTLGRVTLGFE